MLVMTDAGTLFEATQRRIAQAREKLDSIEATDEVRRAGHRHLNRLDRASRSDLSIASREVEAFHNALDAGEVPIYD
jgi:hypothetical protein